MHVLVNISRMLLTFFINLYIYIFSKFKINDKNKQTNNEVNF